ncbi:MAG: V-type ATP synthase subunit F [Candidatus Bathyarchaeia archaeon]
MGKLSVVADKETATYFKIAGVKNSFIAENELEAKEAFDTLYSNPEVSLIMVTQEVFEWVQDSLKEVKNFKDHPIVVAIPGKSGKVPKAELLVELIKKTIGVEIKIK